MDKVYVKLTNLVKDDVGIYDKVCSSSFEGRTHGYVIYCCHLILEMMLHSELFGSMFTNESKWSSVCKQSPLFSMHMKTESQLQSDNMPHKCCSSMGESQEKGFLLCV